jgi:hypothetical protein
MTRRYVYRQTNIYRRIAITVSHYVSRANEGFSLTKSRRMALGVIKKLYPERCVRRAVQTALNGRAAAATDD